MLLARKIVAPTFVKLLSIGLKIPTYSFAYLSIFENPKTPAQLHPSFKKPTRIKGQMKQKRRGGRVSLKIAQKTRGVKQRLKNHKGMLKRVKIVGPRWNRRFKRLFAQRHHKRRHKTRANLLRKKGTTYVSDADVPRVKKLIPYFKRKSLKNMY